jgi:hypothetical protein
MRMGWALEAWPGTSRARLDMELGGGWLELEAGVELELELELDIAI